MSLTFAGPVPIPAAQTKSLNVLITGASRGLGYGLVQQYAAAHAGNHVFAGVRSVSGQTTAALTAFAKSHPNVHIIPLDVSNDQSITGSVKYVSDIVDHLDVIINNAGILGEVDPLKATSKDLVSTFSTNVVGPLLVVQSYLSLLQASGEGKVINVSTALGSNQYVWAFQSPLTSYGTSKEALNYLNNLLSHAIPNILFLAIHPGWVDTDMGGAAAEGTKPPTTIQDSVQAIRYYTAEKNAKANNGEYLDITNGQIIAY
jgi:NAD(P)-dependent dehydrogenase (short-subunit alcohol dehydrogenase family)